ncbi:MAG: T9SS type A sorting domain-containing protein [Lewinella sp.]|nr:T9SS type A sorting domain-containing protein [Lewinella sp.]
MLYSLNCNRLEELLRGNPAAAARLVRRALLQGVVRQSSLSNLLVTGGRLDVAAAWEILARSCQASTSSTLKITELYPNPARVAVNLAFADPSQGPYTVKLLDTRGRVQRQYKLPVDSAFPGVHPLNTVGLPRGFYILYLSNERQSDCRALVLQ